MSNTNGRSKDELEMVAQTAVKSFVKSLDCQSDVDVLHALEALAAMSLAAKLTVLYAKDLTQQ